MTSAPYVVKQLRLTPELSAFIDTYRQAHGLTVRATVERALALLIESEKER